MKHHTHQLVIIAWITLYSMEHLFRLFFYFLGCFRFALILVWSLLFFILYLFFRLHFLLLFLFLLFPTLLLRLEVLLPYVI